MILDLWGISFHAVVVFGLGKNLLFKSILGHCVKKVKITKRNLNLYDWGNQWAPIVIRWA